MINIVFEFPAYIFLIPPQCIKQINYRSKMFSFWSWQFQNKEAIKYKFLFFWNKLVQLMMEIKLNIQFHLFQFSLFI